MWRILNSSVILMIMHRTVFCLQTCSELEFSGVSKNTLHATEGTTVSLHFHLNTKQCSQIPDEFIIKISRERNGRLVDLCRIRLYKQAEKNCILSDTSTSCNCLSSDGRMLFLLKHVTRDDEGVYVWRWNEQLTKEVEKNLTQVAKTGSVSGSLIMSARGVVDESQDSRKSPNLIGPGLMSRDTMTTLSTPDAKPPSVLDAKQPEVEVAPANITRASHQQNADNPLDTRLIVSSAILAGVVVVAVIGAVLIFCLKGHRSNIQTHSSNVEGVIQNNFQLPSARSVPREQASDIYDEIPDRAKLQNAGSRGTIFLYSLSRKYHTDTLVSSVNSTELEPLLSGEVPPPTSFVEYLRPVSVCTEN